MSAALQWVRSRPATSWRRAGAGDLAGFNALTQGPNADPAFIAQWGNVQNQLVSEGNALASDAVTNAKGVMADAFTQIGQSWGVPDLSKAAAQYTVASQSLLGAYNTVSGLISAANSGGIQPQQVVTLFTSTLIPFAIASGTVTAGVGAAIIAGLTAILQALQAGNCLPTGRPTASLCGEPFPYFGGNAPTYALNCMGFSLNPAGPYSQNSPLWIHFPEPASDPDWFSIYATHFSVQGLPSPGPNGNYNTARHVNPDNSASAFASAYGPRLVDAAWPQYRHLECEQSYLGPGAIGDFQKAYFQAWKANQALALNGQKSASDVDVLAHLLTLWNGPVGLPGNGSHSNATTYPFPNLGSQYLSAVGPPPCSAVASMGSYVSYLVTGMQAKYSNLLTNGTDLVINTGPIKTVKDVTGIALTGAAAAAAPSTAGVTASKVSVALGAGALAAVGIYAVKEKISYLEAWQRLYDKAAGALRRR